MAGVTIAEMRRRFERVDITLLTSNAMGESSEDIVQMNRDQMYSGETKDGERITPEYTPLTVFLKNQEGKPSDRVTLNDTGAFYRAMYLRIIGDTFEITSADGKTSDLVSKYGRDVFGLNAENRARLWREFIQSQVVREIARITGVTYA